MKAHCVHWRWRKNNFKDALAQNRVFAFGEQQDIQAHLARTYLVSGDILCNLSRFEEACVSYEDALKYGALEAQQKLASLQNPSREREEVVIQIANGLGGQMIDGSGNTSYLHFNPTDKDLQLYAEVQKQQTSLEQVLAVLPQVRAGKGGRTVVQFASGVANIPTSGQNNKITTIWGVNNTSETIPGPNPMNLG